MIETGEFAILDMEWTSWEGAWKRGWSGPGEFREIVQIGMVIVANTPELEELRALQVLVKPILNPILSAYFMDLTGISQSDVDENGVALMDAMAAMQQSLKGPSISILSNGRDGKYLRENCEKVGIDFIFERQRFLNIRADISSFLNVHADQFTSSDLPMHFGFAPPGTAHDAVADCRCIAGALRIMRAAGDF